MENKQLLERLVDAQPSFSRHDFKERTKQLQTLSSKFSSRKANFSCSDRDKKLQQYEQARFGTLTPNINKLAEMSETQRSDQIDIDAAE